MGPFEGADPSDKDLVLAYQHGEGAAYDALYKRHSPRVRAVCSRMLRDPQDAEEAVQETFLRAYRHLGRFNGRYQISAWLTRIATNVCVDLIRVKTRATVVGLPSDLEDLRVEEGPEASIARANPRLDEAIRTIRPLHADALKLRAVDGLSHEEIAGRLSLSSAQVKALLHRARGSLKRAWDKAEGWAVAPLLGVRHLFGGRETPPAQAAALSDSGAFVLEKVAASVVLAAVAITGAAADHDAGSPGDTDPDARGRVVTAGTGASDHPRFGHAVVFTNTRRSGEPSGPAQGTPAQDVVEAAVVAALDTIEGVRRDDERDASSPDADNDDAHDDGGGVGGAQQASREGAAAVRRAARDLTRESRDLVP